MKKSILYIFVIATCIALISCVTSASETEENTKKPHNQEDYKNVEAAILDYVNGLYLVDSTRIEKSVATSLRKIGFYYNAEKNEYVDNLEMTHAQLVRLAARWNSDYDQVDENSPKEIEIFDVNSKTASAKLTAEWGIDLFHLAKINDQWKIVNVIWQSQPEQKK